MSIFNRLRKLEQSNAASNGMLLLFLQIPGDNERDDYLSVSIHGVGHFERKPEETTQEFKRRAYATQAAGKDPGTLTAEEQAAAYRAGDARRLAHGTPAIITIGGE
ncbi:hypothetical protein [Roseovarius atlanticus]|uniref:hypothetical protein n=1 Tax=Roseovarius atlanticus TaxID=1641875 RepID=UPI001C96DBD6|nr:hypothetical protein [Roseovarius atlanticus]MBY5987095.1 hypothetical protein [Roseovarius atlanticus]MBY6125735.1 hypothetical protein [Roseovarius atlanticus]MBY6149804.1 hypothetical protein [Roseovarius atlanticus]